MRRTGGERNKAPSDLCDSDVVAWSAHQADLLRRVAAAELPRARLRAAPPLADNGVTPLTKIDLSVFSEDQVLGAWLP